MQLGDFTNRSLASAFTGITFDPVHVAIEVAQLHPDTLDMAPDDFHHTDREVIFLLRREDYAASHKGADHTG